MRERTLPQSSRPIPAVALFGALLLVVGWVFWPTFATLSARWSVDPQYTHGYVVPVFALIVLWFRRDSFPGLSGPSLWGLPCLLLAIAFRLAGAAFAFEWLEAGAFVPALVGISLLTLGAAATRWAWPVVAFLAFVLPWPWQFDQMLTYPLRRIATVCSTYLLQTLGQPALARGNVTVINELEVGVVEACSGLGMLMTFFALSTAVAFVVRQPPFDRVAIFLSAIPIGVLMNVARITVTVWLYQIPGTESLRQVFHDAVGWVMMPAALLILWLESCYLSRLWIAEGDNPLPVSTPNIHLPPPVNPPIWTTRRKKQPRPVDADLPLQEIPDAAP